MGRNDYYRRGGGRGNGGRGYKGRGSHNNYNKRNNRSNEGSIKYQFTPRITRRSQGASYATVRDYIISKIQANQIDVEDVVQSLKDGKKINIENENKLFV